MKLYSKILRLGLPILVGQLGMIVVGFADTNMVGRYTTEALASASFVNNVFNVALLACLGFTFGLTPLVGALYARHDSRGIGATVRAAVVANTVFALAVTALMAVVYLNLHRLGQPEELLPLIRPYYLIYLAGVVPVALFNVFAQWSYAINRTKMPMWITLGCNAVNIAGNWLLIYGHCGCPELGLTGAGIATLVARVGGAVAIFAVFALKRCYRPYREGYTSQKPSRADLLKVGATSWPVALQMALETAAFSLSAVMAGWLGAIELAAYQIIAIVGTLGFCVYSSMTSAVSVLVSNAAGTSDYRQMRRIAFAGYRIVLVMAVVASGVFLLLGRHLVGFFTEDPAVLTVGVTLMTPLVLYQLGDATQMTFANAVRGTSRVMVMSRIAFVSYILIGLPSTWTLAFPLRLGIQGIVYSFSVSLFTAAILFVYFFLRYTRGECQ